MRLAVVCLVACGGDGDPREADFVAAIPDAESLKLVIEDDQPAMPAVVGQASELRSRAITAMAALNGLVTATDQRIRGVLRDSAAVGITLDGLACRRFEADASGIHWQIPVCRVDADSRVYTWEVLGRPVTSNNDLEYRLVFAGQATLLGDGERSGTAGWNLDALGQLTGADVAGAAGLGFRVVGNARQIVLALDAARAPGATAQTGMFRYVQIGGRGGSFSFVGPADVIANDAGNPVLGQDAVAELARVAVAWKFTEGARLHAIACGGTAAADGDAFPCVQIAQCWTPTGPNAVTFEELAPSATDPSSVPAWPTPACTDPSPGSVDQPVSEADETVPADDADTGAPSVDEPGAIPEETEEG